MSSKDIARRLRDDIRALDYAFGDRLPTQRALAERFNVSQSTAREAIRYLASEGLVESRHGSGVYVCAPTRVELDTSKTYFDAETLSEAEQRAIGSQRDQPAAQMAGELFLCLRNELSAANWVDSWRVSASKIVLEWPNGPRVHKVLEVLLPSRDDPEGEDVQYGIPGLRLIRQNVFEAELTWLHMPGSHALLRRLEW